ncbi:MAG: cytochrome c oxidase subunit 3 [Acidobacteria bacterium]|nr:cytochrome c oxidase subunit 3 [Acidobacteriota bacterium]
MEVGTIDIASDLEDVKIAQAGRRPGGGPPRGGGGGNPDPGGDSGGGSGGDMPDLADGMDDQQFVPNKSRVFTGFLLVVVMMTFGGLLAAYVIVATNKALEWHPFALPIQVWMSTAIIITSSATYHFGKLAIDSNDSGRAKKWLIATTVLGAAFISSQLLAWIALRSQGLYMSGNPYAGFFYILTAVHAIHVLGGIVALGSIVLRVWYPRHSDTELARRRTLAEVVGWYWHFMGGLWILIFVLLGFWK